MVWPLVVAAGLGAAGLASGYLGNKKSQQALDNANRRYRDSLAQYQKNEGIINKGVTKDLYANSRARQSSLSDLLAGMSPDQQMAVANHGAGLGMLNAGHAAGMANAFIPYGENYSTVGSGATANLNASLGAGTNNRLGTALGYVGATRGQSALSDYHQNLLNTLGTQYTSLDRQAGQTQADAALRQAAVERIWQKLSADAGQGIQNAQYAGNNAKMLGQALMLGGTYAGSYGANQPYRVQATDPGIQQG